MRIKIDNETTDTNRYESEKVPRFDAKKEQNNVRNDWKIIIEMEVAILCGYPIIRLKQHSALDLSVN